jgi:Domain of Unknown Function (DUF928)
MKLSLVSNLLFFGSILAAASAVHSQQSPATQGAKPSANAPGDSAVKPKKKLDADLSGFDLTDEKSKKMSTMFGGSRGAAFPSATLYAPKRAKLYGSAALFQWTSEGRNDGYVLLITDEDETQIVKQAVKDPSYRLPSAVKFEPGQTYYWRVQVLPATVGGDPQEIQVVSAAERTEIDKAIAASPAGDPYQAGLARARVYTAHGLWFDAIGTYSDLIAKYPDRAEPYDKRGKIYSLIDATSKLSAADAAKAASLAK